jgi:signal transduction histidine kinase
VTTQPRASDAPLVEASALDLGSLLGEVIERLEEMRGAGDRLTGLLDAVVAVPSGLDLHQTLRRIVTSAVDLVDAEYGALGVLGPSATIAEFISVGLDEAQVTALGEPPQGHGILGLLIKQPTPVRLDDLGSHPDSFGFPPGHPEMHSFVGVPIRVRDEVFGNLYLTEKRHGGRFTDQDEQVLVALAAAAGVAIENARLFAQAELRSSWLRASSDIVTAVLRGERPHVVLGLVAERAREAADADLSSLALPDQAGRLVVEHAAGEDADGLVGVVVPDDALVTRVMTSGEAILTDTVTQPLALAADNLRDGYATAMVVPLVAGGRTLGSLTVANRRGRPTFGAEEFGLARSFAAQAALALELAEARSEQQRLAVLEDRDRIARDLHDLVIQRLFATGMMLQGASRTTGQPEVADRIERAVQELDATILEVRSTIFALHEGRGEPTGLRGRVLRELGASAHSLGFEPTLRFDGPVDSVVPDEVGDHVVAALREALSNVARHAEATSVRVSLSVDDTDVVLIVTDDGVGMVTESRRRSGLANLEQRASALDGECHVEPAPGESGTRLVWRAPVRPGS